MNSRKQLQKFKVLFPEGPMTSKDLFHNFAVIHPTDRDLFKEAVLTINGFESESFGVARLHFFLLGFYLSDKTADKLMHSTETEKTHLFPCAGSLKETEIQ